MERRAQIVDGIVENVAVFDPENVPEAFADWVPCGGANPGWSYVDGVFVPPPAPPKLPRRIGTGREFLRLFTEGERLDFFGAVSASPQLALWWAGASSGNSFSLDHPSVSVGLAGLVASGLLTQERADEIAAADFDAVA